GLQEIEVGAAARAQALDEVARLFPRGKGRRARQALIAGDVDGDAQVVLLRQRAGEHRDGQCGEQHEPWREARRDAWHFFILMRAPAACLSPRPLSRSRPASKKRSELAARDA